ncbi:MAG: glutamate racemase [Clostridia bacterium]|nr:glutamate racemase [Clostridia bacterium]
MADRRAIGVFDSGLGGLTVVKELAKALPNEDIIYFGDTGRVPYGTRSRDTIRKYAAEDEAFLLSKDVKLIIAACGTVSSVAADTAENLPVPFFEVVTPAAREAVSLTKNGKIGVIGTAATIKSARHEKNIKALMPEAQVTATSCTMFVPLVEEGWHNSEDIIVLETVKRYLSDIVKSGCDTLILGCTHYPVLSDAIQKVVGRDVRLVNAGTATAEAVKEYLNKNGIATDKKDNGVYRFFVSDKPESFRNIASSLLGETVDEDMVEQVSLNDL